MFCKLNQNYFTMERGDTFELPLEIYEGTDFNRNKYYLTPNDKIYVAILQPHESFENAIIRKVIDINSDIDRCGNPIFTLESIDTEYLLTGKYFITAKIEQKICGRTFITTILPMKEFFIEGTNKHIDKDTIIKHTTSVTNNGDPTWEKIDGESSSQDTYVWEKI